MAKQHNEKRVRTAKYLPLGCVAAISFALVTCLLLIINGSVVIGLLDSLPAGTPTFLKGPKVIQFLLFFSPVLMVVIEWQIIDAVMGIFVPKQSFESEDESIAAKIDDA